MTSESAVLVGDAVNQVPEVNVLEVVVLVLECLVEYWCLVRMASQRWFLVQLGADLKWLLNLVVVVLRCERRQALVLEDLHVPEVDVELGDWLIFLVLKASSRTE